AGLDIVLRTATAATTLTITTTKNGGDGITAIHGISVNGAGTVTVAAALSDVSGDIAIAGPLAALTLRNWTGGKLTAAGTSANLTTITGNVFLDDTITIGSQLNTLTVAKFARSGLPDAQSAITAASFGTLNVNGNTAQGVTGDLDATFVNTNLAASPA